jgi:hypothetical protein
MTTRIKTNNINSATLASIGSAGGGGIKVSAVVLSGTATAVDTTGGNVITLTGSGFASGANVFVDTTICSNTTFVNSTSLLVTVPAKSVGSYNLFVYNTDGSVGLVPNGITYSAPPAWTTSAGNIGSIGSAATGISLSVAATGDAPLSYALTSGSLPSGLSLNTSTGAITGTAPTIGSATTYNFTITVSDGQNQTVARAFSIDVVLTPSTLQFIVVGGGGSGGGYSGSGGGGAGGYRSSITGEASGRGTSAETAIANNASGSSYTITIGAGGAGVTGEEVTGFKGSNTSISGSGITTIMSLGGGAGGPNSSGVTPRRYDTEGAGNGGCGGGAAQIMGSPVVQGLGTAGQGYDCGTNDSNGNGSGGGGAGGQGGQASIVGFGGIGVKSNVTIAFGGTGSLTSGNGMLTITAVNTGVINVGTQVTGTNIPAGAYIVALGSGLGGVGTYHMNTNSTGTTTGVAITSTGRYYSGGGSGSAAGYGGAGGGGANPGQTNNIASSKIDGFNNTGGGGGGLGTAALSGAGGSGVVIVRHTAGFTATCTGSPVVTTAGGYTVYQFTSSGSMTF